MLQVAIDYLANLELGQGNDNYMPRVIYTNNNTTPISVVRQVNMQQDVSSGKIQFPRNIVDRAIDYLRTPFSSERMQQLRYMRSVLP